MGRTIRRRKPECMSDPPAKRSRDIEVHRMDIWFVELGKHPGTSVQEGCRPVLVISGDEYNQYSRVITVLPMTSKLKKEWMATHIPLSEEEIEEADDYGYFDPSMVLAEQMTAVDKKQFRSYVGRVIHEGKIKQLEGAALAQLGMKEDISNEDYHVRASQ